MAAFDLCGATANSGMPPLAKLFNRKRNPLRFHAVVGEEPSDRKDSLQTDRGGCPISIIQFGEHDVVFVFRLLRLSRNRFDYEQFRED